MTGNDHVPQSPPARQGYVFYRDGYFLIYPYRLCDAELLMALRDVEMVLRDDTEQVDILCWRVRPDPEILALLVGMPLIWCGDATEQVCEVFQGLVGF